MQLEATWRAVKAIARAAFVSFIFCFENSTLRWLHFSREILQRRFLDFGHYSVLDVLNGCHIIRTRGVVRLQLADGHKVDIIVLASLVLSSMFGRTSKSVELDSLFGNHVIRVKGTGHELSVADESRHLWW